MRKKIALVVHAALVVHGHIHKPRSPRGNITRSMRRSAAELATDLDMTQEATKQEACMHRSAAELATDLA